MLEVQKFLQVRKHENPAAALRLLETLYNIKYKMHEDGRVILDYDMISSPKFHPITRECRGLVLNWKKNWELVAKGFTRFYNYGEGSLTENPFDFDNGLLGFHKEDGSMILLYFYEGKWKVNTRFSFAESKVNDSDYTWEELFWRAASLDENGLNPEYTYVCELCTTYNKVVRHYESPTVYLLSAFKGEVEQLPALPVLAFSLRLPYPPVNSFKGIDEAINYIKQYEEKDKTFEGLVLVDKTGNRLKVKSASYLLLHKKFSNRTPNVEDIVYALTTDDGGQEFLVYFPEYKEKFRLVAIHLDVIRMGTQDEYKKVQTIESQKDFALAVKDNDFSYIYFAYRKGLTWDDIMKQYSSRVVKYLEQCLEKYFPKKYEGPGDLL